MARIITTGFETGNVNYEGDARGPTNTLVTNIVRTGNYSLSMPSYVGANSQMRWNFYAEKLELFYGLGFYTNSVVSNNIFIIYDQVGKTVGSVAKSASNQLEIRVGSNIVADSGAWLFTSEEWHYLEVYWKADDSVGVVTVKLDGEIWVNYSGNTIGDGAGLPAYFILYPVASSNMLTLYDDLVVNDTSGTSNNSWPGRVKLIPIYPIDAGDVTGLTRGGVDSGENWDQVDEVPGSDSDYVYSDTENAYDLYTMSDPVIDVGYSIVNVIGVVVSSLDSGEGKVTNIIKENGVEAQGVDHVLDNSYHIYTDCFPTRPGGSTWTLAAVNALQAGPKVRA